MGRSAPYLLRSSGSRRTIKNKNSFINHFFFFEIRFKKKLHKCFFCSKNLLPDLKMSNIPHFNILCKLFRELLYILSRHAKHTIYTNKCSERLVLFWTHCTKSLAKHFKVSILEHYLIMNTGCRDEKIHYCNYYNIIDGPKSVNQAPQTINGLDGFLCLEKFLFNTC